MKYRSLFIFALFFASLSLTTQVTGSTMKPSYQDEPPILSQEKWVVIPIGALDNTGQPYTVTVLLSSDQVCNMEGKNVREKALCYEHWELLPYEQYPLQSDEIEMPYGSTYMRTTEEALCVLVRGIHRASSSSNPVDVACHALWEKYSKKREK